MIAFMAALYALLLVSITTKLTATYVTCAPIATIFFLDHLLSDFINFTTL